METEETVIGVNDREIEILPLEVKKKSVYVGRLGLYTGLELLISEDPQLFADLQAAVWADLRPAGFLEEQFAGTVVAGIFRIWRIRGIDSSILNEYSIDYKHNPLTVGRAFLNANYRVPVSEKVSAYERRMWDLVQSAIQALRKEQRRPLRGRKSS